MIVFAIGDVVGEAGCRFLRSRLPAFRKFKGIDLCIVNAENSAAGNGVTPESAQYLLSSGADMLTTGNHVYKRKEIYSFLEENECILRPENFYKENPGKGHTVLDMGRVRVGVMNLAGNAFLDPAENAFLCADATLKRLDGVKIRLLDFHAETTGEKCAMGFYLDGRVSAVFGTHTHVQTSDEQVLPNGTGYITDLGMTGAIRSVLGVKPECVIEKLVTGMPVRFSNPDTDCKLEGCLFDIDEKTGRCRDAERIRIT